MLEFDKIYHMDVLEGLRQLPDNCIYIRHFFLGYSASEFPKQ